MQHDESRVEKELQLVDRHPDDLTDSTDSFYDQFMTVYILLNGWICLHGALH